MKTFRRILMVVVVLVLIVGDLFAIEGFFDPISDEVLDSKPMRALYSVPSKLWVESVGTFGRPASEVWAYLAFESVGAMASVYMVDNFVSYVGGEYSATNTYYTFDFTLDEVPNEDVYIIGLSQFSSGPSAYLNIAGYNNNSGGDFYFKVYGDELVAFVLELYVIIDNGDKNLFSISDLGQLTIGFAGSGAFLGNDDVVLTSASVSIGESSFGDVSLLDYEVGAGWAYFEPLIVDSTAPELATIALLGLGCLMLRRKK